MDKEWDTSAPGGTATYEDYQKWLAQGRTMAQKHSGYQWRLGDWLLFGETRFDPGTIPGYLVLHKTTTSDGESGFKGEKIPNYWKDASDHVGIPVNTLKEYAYTARAYPKKKRFKELSFTHHYFASSYEKRFEYLAACLVPGEKPRSINWLWKLIRTSEGEQKEIESTKFLRFMIPEEMYDKLKDLGKWYGTPIPDLVQKACVNVVGEYLEEQAKHVSLEKYGMYDGKWPFYEPTEFNKDEAKKVKAEKKTWRNNPRRTPRKKNGGTERQRQASTASWQARRDRLKNSPSAQKPVQITRSSKLGRVA